MTYPGISSPVRDEGPPDIYRRHSSLIWLITGANENKRLLVYVCVYVCGPNTRSGILRHAIDVCINMQSIFKYRQQCIVHV